MRSKIIKIKVKICVNKMTIISKQRVRNLFSLSMMMRVQQIVSLKRKSRNLGLIIMKIIKKMMTKRFKKKRMCPIIKDHYTKESTTRKWNGVVLVFKKNISNRSKRK